MVTRNQLRISETKIMLKVPYVSIYYFDSIFDRFFFVGIEIFAHLYLQT